jgi:hypothetical protein
MLRCLGVKFEHVSYMFGGNLGVVQNATMKDSLLNKKHVAILYHLVWEAAAAGIAHPTMKIHTSDNYEDVLMQKPFNTIFGAITYGWSLWAKCVWLKQRSVRIQSYVSSSTNAWIMSRIQRKLV